MRYIYFTKAGIPERNDKVFFTSRHRTNGLYYNRHKYETVFRIPQIMFKKFFTFESNSGIYHNNLAYSELQQYATIYKNNEISNQKFL